MLLSCSCRFARSLDRFGNVPCCHHPQHSHTELLPPARLSPLMVSPSLSVVSSSLVLLLANGGRAFSPAPGGALEEVMQSAEAALCDNVTQYSGYFKLATGDKNYFYCACPWSPRRARRVLAVCSPCARRVLAVCSPHSVFPRVSSRARVLRVALGQD